ncbi:hypothetical protein BLNAU_15155 [Blattamonas nauphoetae]|uniref:RRM domain-containing protein n=1 Tax=Blattamonas nauphoetae TaxID=2049346 RepID=A0ABQ9XBN2_9EUKA|nr:hypothetical protein BLNAU_15155 [Blattamonas nauphoetae]
MSSQPSKTQRRSKAVILQPASHQQGTDSDDSALFPNYTMTPLEEMKRARREGRANDGVYRRIKSQSSTSSGTESSVTTVSFHEEVYPRFDVPAPAADIPAIHHLFLDSGTVSFDEVPMEMLASRFQKLLVPCGRVLRCFRPKRKPETVVIEFANEISALRAIGMLNGRNIHSFECLTRTRWKDIAQLMEKEKNVGGVVKKNWYGEKETGMYEIHYKVALDLQHTPLMRAQADAQRRIEQHKGQVSEAMSKLWKK